MKQTRFLQLLSRKLANEATQEELEELTNLKTGDSELSNLYNTLTQPEPVTEEDTTRAEQSYAVHSIKMHLAAEEENEAELVTVTQQSAALQPLRRRLLSTRTFFMLLLFMAAGFGISRLITGGQNSASISSIVEVPAGQRKKIVLPDGSVVWLNSKSRLTYPSAFNNSTREVELEGEALFDVTHNPDKPFTVVTPAYRINVLGTVFNVKSYSANNVFETTLISGSVKVQEKKSASVIAVLKPNEKFSHDNKTIATSVTKVDAPAYATWTDGLYQFDHVTFGEMLNDLQMYKEVHIMVEDSSLLSIICTGKFRQNESIEQIMDVMKTDFPFNYTYTPQTKELHLLPAK